MRLHNAYEKETLKRLTPQEMIRTALVNGMLRSKYGQEAGRYYRLVQKYSKIDTNYFQRLVNPIGKPRQRTKSEKENLDHFLDGGINYKSKKWKRIDKRSYRRK